MKTSALKSHFNVLGGVNPNLARALVVATLCCGAVVQGAEGDANQPATSPPSGTSVQPAAPASASVKGQSVRKRAPGQPSAQALSPLVKDVIKLADADVSTNVIKAFVESSPSADPLTDADIIALKQHKVPDEIVTILLKQGAKLRALNAQRKSEALARALAARNARFGGMDPESYDYFRYYYLQPRAMASVYRRLAPYYGPWGYYYPYGPYPGFGYRHNWYGRLSH